MLNKKKSSYLSKLYYNPSYPSSFGGINQFYKSIKNNNLGISRNEVKEWLSSQEPYTSHRSLKRKFLRPKVIAPYKYYMMDFDTGYYEKYGNVNDGYKYFLIGIDILSHFVNVIPLKSLKADEVAKAMKNILEINQPYIVRTDKGSEFVNTIMKRLLKDRGVKHITTTNETKANYAERAIKTLKSKISKYFSSEQTHRWIDQIDNFVNNYNNSVHRSINISPQNALKENDSDLFNYQYNYNNILNQNPKLKLNDHVKISFMKKPFNKEYDEKWTNEIFLISSVRNNQGIPLYSLKDFHNDQIEGTFYENELQKVLVNDDTVYKIEKILTKRKRKGKNEYLVKWLGWPEKFNTYVSESELKDFKNTK
jgi:hypothetical protein